MRATHEKADEPVREMLDLAPLPMWVVDAATLRFLAVNDAAVAHYGYGREEFLSRTTHDLRPPGGAVEPDSAPDDDGAPRVEAVHLKSDGSTIRVEVTARPVSFAGRSARLALVVDVTERSRVSETYRFLAEASALLTTSLDYRTRLSNLARLSVPRLADYCLVDIVEDDGTVARIEAAHADPDRQELVQRLLRFPPIQYRAGGVSEVMRTGGPALTTRIDDAFLQAAAQSPEHLACVRRLHPTSCFVVPLTVRGRAVGAISFVMAESGRGYDADTMELATEIARRAGFAIENARLYRRARQAIRAREEVLSVVSHELRNPLSATSITLDLVLDATGEDLPASLRKRLESIRWFTNQMTSLVDDLVDVVRLEAGQLPMRLRQQKVEPLVQESLAAVRPLADSRSIVLRTELSAPLPDILVDRARVLQLFGNLLANSIRAGAPGSSVTVRASAGGDGEVGFAVADTGPGIPSGELATLFGRRALPEASGTGGGLGMGLAIASGIVRAHGGQIWAESEVGKGSTFSFTLAAAGADEVDDGEESEEGIPVVGSLFGPSAAPARRSAESPPSAPDRRPRDLLADLSAMSGSGEDPTHDPEAQLRTWITRALHLGHLRVGDRLPSIREAVRACNATKHTIVRAYQRLEQEGVIEARNRSGIYVADPNRREGAQLLESAEWLADVLGEACELQLRVPILPGLIERWTSAVRLVCACVESDSDHLSALCTEYSAMFGFDSIPVRSDSLPVSDFPLDPDDLPPEVRNADLILTTAFHAPIARAVAEALRKPLVVATADPETVATIERRVRARPLTVICKDPRFGDRMRDLHSTAGGKGIRVVLADDAEALDRMDGDDPVLLTHEARQVTGDRQLRLLIPRFPSFSLDAARELARLVIQLNISAERRLRPHSGDSAGPRMG